MSVSFVWIFFAVIAIVATVHRLALGSGSFNNYVIFEYSWKHLLDNVNLYAAYPDDHYDLYKYSPTFAALMGPFSILPHWLGLLFWNSLNMLTPVWAVSQLKFEQKQKNLILFIVFIELLSSVQNAQSNGIMLGLIIGAFACFEKNKPVMALLLICLGFYIKLFAAAAAVMLFFYPKKVKSIFAGAIFVVLLGLLPLVVISWESLVIQYQNWLVLLQNDPAHELNFSFMTLLERTIGLHAGDIFFLLPGALLLLLPLFRVKQYCDFNFRLLFLCSVLIWVVIFNHKAESPTYCIAMGGIAIWYVCRPSAEPVSSVVERLGLTKDDHKRKSVIRHVVFWLAFLLVALSPTDLFPQYVRVNFIQPYSLKALMPVVIWMLITWDLLVKKNFLPLPSETTQTASHTTATH